MVKNFNSCRTCGKHSHNLQKLSHWISSTHNSTIPIVFFNQSLGNGLDWMANIWDLWLLFSVLKDCQSMWHFMKRVNSLMATIKLLSPVLTTTAIPGLGILISVIQGFLYFAPLAVSLPSRTASFRPEANSAALRRGEGAPVLMSALQRGGIFRHPRRSPQQ